MRIIVMIVIISSISAYMAYAASSDTALAPIAAHNKALADTLNY